MRLLALALLLALSSCSVEERIYQWSYTEDWYWKGDDRYQVYKTLGGRRYIIVIDTVRLELEREYLKKPDNDTGRNRIQNQD